MNKLNTLRKHLNYENQLFFTLHPKGKQLIIILVERRSLLFSFQIFLGQTQ
jgi:hypothetical protein